MGSSSAADVCHRLQFYSSPTLQSVSSRKAQIVSSPASLTLKPCPAFTPNCASGSTQALPFKASCVSSTKGTNCVIHQALPFKASLESPQRKAQIVSYNFYSRPPNPQTVSSVSCLLPQIVSSSSTQALPFKAFPQEVWVVFLTSTIYTPAPLPSNGLLKTRHLLQL